MAANDIAAIKELFRKIARARFNSEDFRECANIVRQERAKGMERGADYEGNKYAPLKPATIKRKAGTHTTQKYKQNRQGNRFVKGGSIQSTKVKGNAANASKPLIDTGTMRDPTISATNTQGKVTLAQARSNAVAGGASIAQIHEQGLGNNPRRRHWGIYPMARRRCELYLKRKMERLWREVMHGA